MVFVAALAAAGYMIVNLVTGGKSPGENNLLVPLEIPAFSVEHLKEGIAPNHFIKAYVSDVTDGDTLTISYQKKEYKVRLLCIDTPESVKQGVHIQPYAIEASRLTEKLTLRKNVRLVFEKGLKDKYGRLLAYIILEDEENLNAILVRNGYARVEIVSPNIKQMDYFLKLQNEAIQDRRGMWGLEADKQPFVRDVNGNYIPRYWKIKEAS